MNISAVTISVNCADYLCHTLPSMRNVFEHLIVVTSSKDKQTQDLCKYWNVQCLVTDIMYSDGAAFNKGLAIQLAIDHMSPQDWIVHIDSDIFLPPRFNEFIRCKKLNKDCIYGIDRLEIKDWNTWMSFYQNPPTMHELGSTWSHLPVMYRVTQNLVYSPVGFYQMWHSQSKYAQDGYHRESINAADSDLKFAMNFPPENRLLIPEVYVYHLSSEGNNVSIGRNWNGRKSPKFGA